MHYCKKDVQSQWICVGKTTIRFVQVFKDQQDVMEWFDKMVESVLDLSKIYADLMSVWPFDPLDRFSKIKHIQIFNNLIFIAQIEFELKDLYNQFAIKSMSQGKYFDDRTLDISEFFEHNSQEHFYLFQEQPITIRLSLTDADYDLSSQNYPLNPTIDPTQESALIYVPPLTNPIIQPPFQNNEQNSNSGSQTQESRKKKPIRKQKKRQRVNSSGNNSEAQQDNDSKCQGTRNFLVFFKNPHQQFFEKYIQSHPQYAYLRNHPDVLRIFYGKKKAISMWDYECLYRIPHLIQCWSTMICQRKYLHHHLVVGKANMSQKLVYRSKINLFKKAFRLGKFEYIN